MCSCWKRCCCCAPEPQEDSEDPPAREAKHHRLNTQTRPHTTSWYSDNSAISTEAREESPVSLPESTHPTQATKALSARPILNWITAGQAGPRKDSTSGSKSFQPGSSQRIGGNGRRAKAQAASSSVESIVGTPPAVEYSSVEVGSSVDRGSSRGGRTSELEKTPPLRSQASNERTDNSHNEKLSNESSGSSDTLSGLPDHHISTDDQHTNDTPEERERQSANIDPDATTATSRPSSALENSSVHGGLPADHTVATSSPSEVREGSIRSRHTNRSGGHESTNEQDTTEEKKSDIPVNRVSKETISGKSNTGQDTDSTPRGSAALKKKPKASSGLTEKPVDSTRGASSLSGDTPGEEESGLDRDRNTKSAGKKLVKKPSDRTRKASRKGESTNSRNITDNPRLRDSSGTRVPQSRPVAPKEDQSPRHKDNPIPQRVPSTKVSSRNRSPTPNRSDTGKHIRDASDREMGSRRGRDRGDGKRKLERQPSDRKSRSLSKGQATTRQGVSSSRAPSHRRGESRGSASGAGRRTGDTSGEEGAAGGQSSDRRGGPGDLVRKPSERKSRSLSKGHTSTRQAVPDTKVSPPQRRPSRGSSSEPSRQPGDTSGEDKLDRRQSSTRRDGKGKPVRQHSNRRRNLPAQADILTPPVVPGTQKSSRRKELSVGSSSEPARRTGDTSGEEGLTRGQSSKQKSGKGQETKRSTERKPKLSPQTDTLMPEEAAGTVGSEAISITKVRHGGSGTEGKGQPVRQKDNKTRQQRLFSEHNSDEDNGAGRRASGDSIGEKTENRLRERMGSASSDADAPKPEVATSTTYGGGDSTSGVAESEPGMAQGKLSSELDGTETGSVVANPTGVDIDLNDKPAQPQPSVPKKEKKPRRGLFKSLIKGVVSSVKGKGSSQKLAKKPPQQEPSLAGAIPGTRKSKITPSSELTGRKLSSTQESPGESNGRKSFVAAETAQQSRLTGGTKGHPLTVAPTLRKPSSTGTGNGPLQKPTTRNGAIITSHQVQTIPVGPPGAPGSRTQTKIPAKTAASRQLPTSTVRRRTITLPRATPVEPQSQNQGRQYLYLDDNPDNWLNPSMGVIEIADIVYGYLGEYIASMDLGGFYKPGSDYLHELSGKAAALIKRIAEPNIEYMTGDNTEDDIFGHFKDDGMEDTSRDTTEMTEAHPKIALTTPNDIIDMVKVALYDVVIYCDDSTSMNWEEGRIPALKELVRRVTRITSTLDMCGIKIRFINFPDDDGFNNIRSIEGAEAVLKPIAFEGGTMIGTGLEKKILNPLLFDKLRAGKLERPLLVTTITDGAPSGEDESHFKNIILKCKETLKTERFQPKSVIFQVSQVGSADEARKFIHILHNDVDIGNMVYCTSEKLDKMVEELRDNDRDLERWLLDLLLQGL